MKVPMAVGLFFNFLAFACLSAFTVFLVMHDIGNALRSFAVIALGGGIVMLQLEMSQRSGPPADLLAEFNKPITVDEADAIIQQFGLVAKQPTDEAQSETSDNGG